MRSTIIRKSTRIRRNARKMLEATVAPDAKPVVKARIVVPREGLTRDGKLRPVSAAAYERGFEQGWVPQGPLPEAPTPSNRPSPRGYGAPSGFVRPRVG